MRRTFENPDTAGQDIYQFLQHKGFFGLLGDVKDGPDGSRDLVSFVVGAQP